jgi:Zinc finger, C2H2 type
LSELNAAINFREKSQNSERILQNNYIDNIAEIFFHGDDHKTTYDQTVNVKSDENFPFLPHECMIKVEKLDEVIDMQYMKTENFMFEQESETIKNPLVFEENKLICKICGNSFGHVRFLNRHIKRHLKAGSKPLRSHKKKPLLTGASIECLSTIPKTENNATLTYECNKCGMCFNSQNILTSHLNSQHINKVKSSAGVVEPSNFVCSHCNREFRQKRHLRRHILRIHIYPNSNKPRIFNCDLCTKAFVDARQLKAHKFKQHDNNSCSICNKKLKHFGSLKNHIAAVHDQLKNFLCALCGKRYVFLYVNNCLLFINRCS